MTRNIFVSQRYNGLELFLLILRDILFRISVSFHWLLKVNKDITCNASDWPSYISDLINTVLSIFLLDKWKVEAMLLRCYLETEVPQWRYCSYTFQNIFLFVQLDWNCMLCILLFVMKVGATVDSAKRSKVWDWSLICARTFILVRVLHTI